MKKLFNPFNLILILIVIGAFAINSSFASTITPLTKTMTGSTSMAVINTDFSNLNTDKFESSNFNSSFDARLIATTSLKSLLIIGYVDQSVKVGSSPTFLTPTVTSTVFNGITYTEWGLLPSLYYATTTVPNQTATTTSKNGFNISKGCFAINNTCISGGGGSGDMTKAVYDTGSNNKVDDTDTYSLFGKDFYTYFHATTTDYLTQGSSNLYWSNTLFDNRLTATTTLPKLTTLAGLSITGSQVSDLSTLWDVRMTATTTLPKITTLASLTTVGTIGTGVWNGTYIDAVHGGTGSTTLSGILKGNGTGAIQTAVKGTDYFGVGSLMGSNGYYCTYNVATKSLDCEGATSGTGALLAQSNAIITTPEITLGSDATGDMYYKTSTNNHVGRLGIGANGYVLQSNGTLPTWVSTSSLGITGTGGGGGGGGGWNFITNGIYNATTSDTVMIASTTITNIANSLEVTGNSLLNGNVTVWKVDDTSLTIKSSGGIFNTFLNFYQGETALASIEAANDSGMKSFEFTGDDIWFNAGGIRRLKIASSTGNILINEPSYTALYGKGKVGIGTSSPTVMLNVYGGDVAFQNNINSATALQVLNAATTSILNVNTITSNVAIPYASTTALTVSGTTYTGTLCLTGDTCRTTWPTGGSGVGTVSTSTVPTVGQLPYWTSNAYPSLLGSVATTSLTGTAPIVFSNPISVIGGSASVITCTAASASVAGCLSAANWTTFNNKWDLASSTIGTTYGGTGLGAGGLKATFIPFGNGVSAFATSSALYFTTGTSNLTATYASTTALTVSGTTYTVTLKVGTYTFPATDGTDGQVLGTDGEGNIGWYSAIGQWSTIPLNTKIYYAGSVGIGTTTVPNQLNVYGKNVMFQTNSNSATAFQILNAATTSVLTVDTITSNLTVLYASSTALTISSTGYLIIPASTAQTPIMAGQIAVDTTTDEFKYYGTEARTLVYDPDTCYTIASTTWNSFAGLTATTSIQRGSHFRNQTYTKYKVYTDSGTIDLRFSTTTASAYGNSTPANMVASTTANIITVNYKVASSDKEIVNISNVSAVTVNQLTICGVKTYDTD